MALWLLCGFCVMRTGCKKREHSHFSTLESFIKLLEVTSMNSRDRYHQHADDTRIYQSLLLNVMKVLNFLDNFLTTIVEWIIKTQKPNKRILVKDLSKWSREKET